MGLTRGTVRTRQGDISTLEKDGPGTAILLVHGNSCCKEVFGDLIERPALSRHRVVAIDLPGHGASSDAVDPRTYSIPGYADVVAETLDALGMDEPIVLGWSLGGHIGIELLGRGRAIAGLMIIGTPPFAPGCFGIMRAFQPHFDLLLATKARLSPQERLRFARRTFGAAYDAMAAQDDMAVAAIERTDPRARPMLLRSMLRGEGVDQRRTVENADVPVAVVNGSQEPFARLDYVAELTYGNLWEGRCHLLDGSGHAPFLDNPDGFCRLFERFLDDETRSAGRLPAQQRSLRSA